MSEIQDRSLQIARVNRGFRAPQQVDDFLQEKNITMTYDAAGNVESMVITKEIAGVLKVKTYSYGYTDGKLTSITQVIS